MARSYIHMTESRVKPLYLDELYGKYETLVSDGVCPWCGGKTRRTQGHAYCSGEAKCSRYLWGGGCVLGVCIPDHSALMWVEGERLRELPFEELPLHMDVEGWLCEARTWGETAKW